MNLELVSESGKSTLLALRLQDIESSIGQDGGIERRSLYKAESPEVTPSR